MLNHPDCARRDELLLKEASKFVPEKPKLINLIDVLFTVQDKLVAHNVGTLNDFLKDFQVKGLSSGVLTQAELALLEQVQERNHSIEYYLMRIEENIGKEIKLYETVSEQITDLVKNRYAIAGLIRHYGGSVTSLFDRLVHAANPLMEHLSLRHSILVPDLFVVLQNQKRQLRNRQWSRFKKQVTQENDILRRLSRQVSLVEGDVRDLIKWHPSLTNPEFGARFFEEENVQTKLVLYVLMIQVFIARAQGSL